MPHKKRMPGVPLTVLEQDCYKRIPIVPINPQTVTLTQVNAAVGGQVTVCFSEAVIISCTPNWLVYVNGLGPFPITGWSTTNLQCYTFTTPGTPPGSGTIVVPDKNLCVLTSGGSSVSNGTYGAGGGGGINACGCSNVPLSLPFAVSGGGSGSGTLVNAQDNQGWVGTAIIGSCNLRFTLSCNVGINTWQLSILPVGQPGSSPCSQCGGNAVNIVASSCSPFKLSCSISFFGTCPVGPITVNVG